MNPINWINHKTVNYSRLETVLKDSVEANHMSNGGPAVLKLESKLRELLQISDDKAIILTNNGTSALHALASALSLFGKHDKKLVFATQAFTFPSSAQGSLDNSIIVDTDLNLRGNLGGPLISDLDDNVNSIDGVIVTNIFGYSVDIDKYVDWCTKNNKLLIFDNAATPYTFYKGKNTCNYGTSSTISFHHTKPLGFGEGGAIIVDKMYAESVTSVINFGKDFNVVTPTWNRNGSNYKMSDCSAAFILQHLDRFYDTVAHHKQIYKLFNNKIPVNRLYNHFSDDAPFVACLIYIAENKDVADHYVDFFQSKGVQCRKYYLPLEPLEQSVSLYNRIICFPCHLDVSINDVNFIVDNLVEIKTFSLNEAKQLEAYDLWPDVYFTPEYGSLIEKTDGKSWEASLGFVNSKVVVGYVYIVKKIGSTDCYDICSPYGYSGVWCTQDCTKDNLINFRKQFIKLIAEKRNCITEFIRFNPYLDQNLCKEVFNSVKVKNTYGVKFDQDTTYEQIFRSCSKNHRRAVTKALKDDYQYMFKKLDSESVILFKKMYTSTMSTVKATPYYYFNDEYFDELVKMESSFICTATLNNQTVLGSSIFLIYGENVHYHLSATTTDSEHKNASNFILDCVVRLCIKNSYKCLHLGGGVTEGDSLEMFKKSLSNTEFNYCFAKNVLNQEVFDKLCSNLDTHTVCTTHFPPYRGLLL